MAEAGETSEEQDRRDAEELVKFASEHSASEVHSKIERMLDQWKSTELNVGVIGATGVGKSTFINTLRRVKPTDPGAAPTGVIETTTRPTAYAHPLNSSIKLWDIPGLGTSEFPKESYLKQIEFDKYDFFVLMCCTRFTENCMWLAHEIQQKDKRFYFVRSKVDIDVRSDREDNPDTHCEERLLEQLKSDCNAELMRAGFKDSLVFLVCKNPLLYDFSTLEEKLISDLPELQYRAALLTLRSASNRVIRCKTVQLKKRSWLLATASGLIGAIPVPGMLIAVNCALLIREINFYKQVYGLDEGALKNLCETAHVSEEEAADTIKEYFWVNLTSSSLLKAIGAPSLAVAFGEGLKFSPSIAVGVASGAASSFTATKMFLSNTIAGMEQAALTLTGLGLSKK